MRFRIGVTDIYLSFWFFAAAALFAAVNAAVFSLYVILPVLVHELGHIAAISICGAKITAVRFAAFGVEIEKAKTTSLSFARGVIISLAGAAANLVLAAGLYFFAPESVPVIMLIAANVALAGFNLLPIGTLDGGEIMRMICERHFLPRLAYILSRVFSFITLTPLFAASIFLVMRPERNFTLLLVCVCLFLDIILRG